MVRKKTEIIQASILLGAHTTGGLKGAVKKALEIGAQTMQIFIGSPQTWIAPSPKYEELVQFAADVKKHRLGPVFVHGNYLVNLASQTHQFHSRSIENLSAALRLADTAGASGLIFHPGSAGRGTYDDALHKVIKGIEQVLAGYDGSCKLLLEVCAGQGETIGDRFSEFRDILEALGWDRRLGICWDTCHLFNAGYDISSSDGLKKTVAEFEEEIGFDWLFAIHACDSKHPLGSRKDRHENIGCGHIGEEAFRRMLAHPQLRFQPWILEVPGFENKGPDKRSIDILRRLSS